MTEEAPLSLIVKYPDGRQQTVHMSEAAWTILLKFAEAGFEDFQAKHPITQEYPPHYDEAVDTLTELDQFRASEPDE